MDFFIKKKENILSRTVYIFGLMLIACVGFTQTTYQQSQYQEGKIWFKLRDNQLLEQELSLKGENDVINNKDLKLTTMPFLEQVFSSHLITRLSRPFPKAYSSIDLLNTYLLEFEDVENAEMILTQLEASGAVEYAEKVPLRRVSLTPNDPEYSASQMWGLFKINAENAWNIGTGSSSIVVAVTDNAIDVNHPDLINQIWTNSGEIPNNGLDDDGNGYVDDVNGYDVGDDDNDPSPPNSSFDHGTHVAGIAGAQSNNSVGIASIGYGITIMPIKSTENAAGPSVITHGYEGIYYAAINGADIINFSWGGNVFSLTEQNLIDFAWGEGSILVGAAGNSNSDNDVTPSYPEGYSNAISVASSASNDKKSGFSNYGATTVDITAPGSNIYSTLPFGNYGFKNGTSMASPMVAGLLGLMKSLNPNMPNTDLINCMYATADNINGANPGYSGELGAGRINASVAMSCVFSTLSNPPVADFTANYTTIYAGGTVTFTDQSTYGPTSWSWNFDNQGLGGVSPSTASTQGPHTVTYTNPGTYEVSLTVSNANGSDTETKITYITVDSIGSCVYLNLDDPTFSLPQTGWHVGWTTAIYNAGPGNGYVSGTNIYGDKAKAEYFPATMVGSYQYVTGVYVWYAKAYATNPNTTIDINVYDATGGSVVSTLGTRTVTMGNTATSTGTLKYYQFSPAVAVPASAEIAVGVDFSNLSFPTDTLLLVTNTHNDPSTSIGIEQLSGGTWNNYFARWSVNISHYIFPQLTNTPAVVNLSATPTNICEGDIVSYDATGSTFQDTLLWLFPGATPNYSNEVKKDVIYNTAGNYKAYLQVLGGGCGNYGVDSVNITVNSKPSVTISSTKDTICSGNTITLNASGASSYLWSLGGSTANSINVSPTSTTTYNVTGTTAGCTDNSSKTIYVEANPVANATFIPLTGICPGVDVNFDGSVSTGASNYSWSFPQGNPSSSTSASPFPVISFGTGGTHNYSLQVTNSCGTNTFNGSITINNPTVTANATNTSICSGQSVTLTGSGATSYTWDNGVTDGVAFMPTSTTTYTVTGVSGGCFNTDQITVTVNTVDITTTTTATQISANATPATYQWMDCGNGYVTITGETGQSYTPTSSGIYAVIVTQNGCTESSLCINFILTGTKELSDDHIIRIYPNPAKEEITVDLGRMNASKLTLLDTQGKLLYTSEVKNNNIMMIDLKDISKGVYFLKVIGDDMVKTYKVIKQ